MRKKEKPSASFSPLQIVLDQIVLFGIGSMKIISRFPPCQKLIGDITKACEQ